MHIFAISGSTRKDSLNTKLLRVAERIARDLGAEVTEIDLKEIALPMYDGDIEAQGIPESVQKLKAAIAAADVLLIATPEYNHSTSAALKNAIEWASRKPSAFPGKVAAIFGASPGMLGAARGQMHLRDIFEGIGVLALPGPEVLVGRAHEAFADDGSIKDPMTVDLLTRLIADTIAFARKLQS